MSDVTEAYIPHSFIMDTRYNTLYQMYLELRKDTFQVEFDSEFSYTWKRSSYLYEMWCFFRIMITYYRENTNQMLEDGIIYLQGKYYSRFLKRGR